MTWADRCPDKAQAQRIRRALLQPTCETPMGKFMRQWTLDETTGCWEWHSGSPSGYGYFNHRYRRGVPEPAHRVAYRWLVGAIPEGLTLDHLCRNRRCVNPDHLEPVTNRENILRGTSPAARYARRAACKRGHPYVLGSYTMRGTSRRCQICQYQDNHARSYGRAAA